MRGHAREIVLGTLLLVILIWAFRPASPPELGPTAEEKQAKLNLIDTIWKVTEDVNFDGLGTGVGDYDGGGRNLFDYGVIKPPPPTAEELAALEAERRRKALEDQRRREEAERLRQEALERQRELARLKAEQQRDNPPVEGPAPRPNPPAVNLRFMGIVGEPKDRIAIFVDGDEFLLAKEGETLKKDFRVDKISYDTLRIGFTDPRFSEEFRILPLGG